jgi:hypothetical protein
MDFYVNNCGDVESLELFRATGAPSPSDRTAFLPSRKAHRAFAAVQTFAGNSRRFATVTPCLVDAEFAASLTPWHKDLAHWQFAQDKMLLAVPKGHDLTKQEGIRLRDLRDIPFVWFPRWVNPVIYDRMMRACARGGLGAPRIVQEARIATRI